jgi:hypothetical protein
MAGELSRRTLLSERQPLVAGPFVLLAIAACRNRPGGVIGTRTAGFQ